MSIYRQAYKTFEEIDRKAQTKEFHEMYDFWRRCHGKSDCLAECITFMLEVWWPMGRRL